MSNIPINLEEFLEGYKKSEVNLGDKRRVFREPKMKDTGMSVMEILENYCIEGDRAEFEKILNNDLPVSKQKDLIEKILNDLGLV